MTNVIEKDTHARGLGLFGAAQSRQPVIEEAKTPRMDVKNKRKHMKRAKSQFEGYSNKSPSTGETPSQPAQPDSHRGSPKLPESRESNLTNSHHNKTISS